MSIAYSYLTNPVTVRENTSVLKALKILIASDQTDLPVVNTKGYPVGTFSIRQVVDYIVPILPEENKDQPLLERIKEDPNFLQKALQGVSKKQVEDIMDVHTIVVDEGEFLGIIVAQMICGNKFIASVVNPVSGVLLGVVTQREVQEHIAKSLKLKVEKGEKYLLNS
jgi:CBS domain-containing protein